VFGFGCWRPNMERDFFLGGVFWSLVTEREVSVEIFW
jgi:hypothetical protein